MPITINGSGTVTGISAGGLPDGCVTTDDLANSAVTTAKLGTNEASGLCKAWVNFNGTGTVAIRASYNVSSITDNGVGDYTVNFTTALADANYAVIGGSGGSYGASGLPFGLYLNASSPGVESIPTTTSCRFLTSKQDGFFDAKYINVAIFR